MIKLGLGNNYRPSLGFGLGRIARAWAGSGGGGDPFASSIISQLRFEGTQNTQTYTDDVDGNTWSLLLGGTTQFIALKNSSSPGGPWANPPWGTTWGYFSAGYGIRSNSRDSLALPQKYTIEMHLRHNGTSGYQLLFDSRASGTGIAIYMLNPNSSSRNIEIWSDSAKLGETPAGSIPVPNTLFHLAVSRDETNTVRVYINGVERTSFTDSRTYVTSGEYRVGSTIGGAQGFYGYMKDLRVTADCRYDSASFTPPGELLPLPEPEAGPFFFYVAPTYDIDVDTINLYSLDNTTGIGSTLVDTYDFGAAGVNASSYGKPGLAAVTSNGVAYVPVKLLGAIPDPQIFAFTIAPSGITKIAGQISVVPSDVDNATYPEIAVLADGTVVGVSTDTSSTIAISAGEISGGSFVSKGFSFLDTTPGTSQTVVHRVGAVDGHLCVVTSDSVYSGYCLSSYSFDGSNWALEDSNYVASVGYNDAYFVTGGVVVINSAKEMVNYAYTAAGGFVAGVTRDTSDFPATTGNPIYGTQLDPVTNKVWVYIPNTGDVDGKIYICTINAGTDTLTVDATINANAEQFYSTLVINNLLIYMDSSFTDYLVSSRTGNTLSAALSGTSIDYPPFIFKGQ